MQFKLHYATSRTPRSSYTWRDWGKLIFIVSLIAFLPLCISQVIDPDTSDYVALGTLLFAAIGIIFGRCMPSRLPLVLIISAFVALLVAVILYLSTSYRLIVDNQSGQPLGNLHVIRNISKWKSTGYDFDLPANTKIELPFHALRFDGVVDVWGTFADGKRFQDSSWTWHRRTGYAVTTLVFKPGDQLVITQK